MQQGITPMPEISIIMPTYNQASFITRALESLKGQQFQDWELIIINDGSSDKTEQVIQRYFADSRLIYIRNEKNQGLGRAINQALQIASGNYISYLPSDDIYYADHLNTLYKTIQSGTSLVLAYSGLRYKYNRYCNGIIDGHPLQLVQVMHKRVPPKWREREEITTDDLDEMYWNKLKEEGLFKASEKITCEWISHFDQRHKKIQEPEGGINLYRSYYKVSDPLRFKSTVGNLIDEVKRFENFQGQEEIKSEAGLTILLVGELAYNPERIIALEERGHKLLGLWMKDPYWYNYVGPLPFGNITTLDPMNWQKEVKKYQPDIIYGLLNWQAVPFVHDVLKNNPGIPFVWNFKEGPFICLEKGSWDKLIDLYSLSDGQIYTSPEMKEWFSSFLPDYDEDFTLLLDGDLPKKDWFSKTASPLLSQKIGETHTVVPGRPIGLHPEVVAELASEKIHLHFYGDFTHGLWKEWIQKTNKLAKGYLHTHPNVDQENWVEEFSQYDAGWLHTFESQNFGEIRRANWDDLNYPARIATLALSGLPLLQKDNSAHIVATQNLVKEHDIGICFTDLKDLSHKLKDQNKMKQLRLNVWEKREVFTFDHHADRLINFFHKVIGRRTKNQALV
jgi:glycosyltransferase involved in cell wall biosynthesis